MSYYPKMAGEKCYLAPINTEDAGLYTQWLNDMDVCRTLTLASASICLEGEQDVLRNVLQKGHNYGIIDKQTDQLIGNCGFVSLDHLNSSGEVGIFIGDKDFWGKGYGTDALSLLVSYGFNYLNLHSIHLKVYNFNPRAIACYEKAGFRKAGVLREIIRREGAWHDEILMDITEEDFRAIM